MREGSVSDVDRQADAMVDLLTRVGAIERLGHIHTPGSAFAALTAGRNLFDNGQMKVAQRNAGVGTALAALNDVYIGDRWHYSNQAALAGGNVTYYGAYPAAPVTPLSTSQHCIIVQNGNAIKTPLTGSEYEGFFQAVEGWRLQELKWGTAQAKPVTLQYTAFFSRATTVVVELNMVAGPRISAALNFPSGASTQTVTFPGHPTVAPTYNNTTQLVVYFMFGAGPGLNDGVPANLNTAWSTTATTTRFSGVTNYFDRINQQVNLYEAQMEPGSVASPIEMRSYADELWRCFRYYRQTKIGVHGEGGMYGNGVAGGTELINMPFPVPMRAAPTPSVGGTYAQVNCTGPILGSAGNGTTEYSYAYWYTVTAAGQYSAYPNNSGYLTFSAEI